MLESIDITAFHEYSHFPKNALLGNHYVIAKLIFQKFFAPLKSPASGIYR